jgi:inosine-uridine nucleoside N-ribohydrolase
MRKIIIDTDPGHDDALAIMLAVKSKAFDILAITTVCGNSTIENTTRNARYILSILDAESIPVYSGANKPLKRDLILAVVHGKSGLDGIDPSNDANLTNNAPNKIIELIENNEDITIVTLGPLTNIAQALLIKPEIETKIKEIIIMGGAIKVPGNKNRVAEFNFFVDPDAADIVMRSNIKKTIVPLDACNNVQMQLSDFEKINNSVLRGPILKMMTPFIRNIFDNEGTNAALVYDALTVYYLLNPSVCKVEKYNIVIETKGEYTFGMSVADLRKKPDSSGSDVNVVMNIDKEAFIEDFIRIINI